MPELTRRESDLVSVAICAALYNLQQQIINNLRTQIVSGNLAKCDRDEMAFRLRQSTERVREYLDLHRNLCGSFFGQDDNKDEVDNKEDDGAAMSAQDDASEFTTELKDMFVEVSKELKKQTASRWNGKKTSANKYTAKSKNRELTFRLGTEGRVFVTNESSYLEDRKPKCSFRLRPRRDPAAVAREIVDKLLAPYADLEDELKS